MKVESKSAFTPMVVTLETREEVYNFMVVANNFLYPNNRDRKEVYSMAQELDAAARNHYNTSGQ